MTSDFLSTFSRPHNFMTMDTGCITTTVTTTTPAFAFQRKIMVSPEAITIAQEQYATATIAFIME